jgi:cytoplasmic polyadenylation element-binding protein
VPTLEKIFNLFSILAEICIQFRKYGPVAVDWPHKSESKSQFPPKGYVFLIFEKESSVQDLISTCTVDKEKFYVGISSSSIKDKPVQIRPWCLNDADYYMMDSLSSAQLPVDPRRTIFVGGVPRPLKSSKNCVLIIFN